MITVNQDLATPLPHDEEERQAAVDRSPIARHRDSPALQKIVDAAADFFNTQFAVISVIDRNRQWFAARHNVDSLESPRAVSFCAHAIHRPGEPLIIPDARQDGRFANNPVVVFAPHIRFYAGVPLVNHQGYPLGALCISDPRPRTEELNLFELLLLARRAERLIVR
jgi:GAF domain-containing protein